MGTNGGQKQAESLAHLSCHDFICLTETWLAADDKPDIFPAHTYYSACRSLSDGPGRHSGGVGVFVSSRVNKHIQFVKAADDASYLWLKLKDVVLGCPEVYLAVCYMPQKRDFMNHQKITPTTLCPYECLQHYVIMAKYKCSGTACPKLSTKNICKCYCQ